MPKQAPSFWSLLVIASSFVGMGDASLVNQQAPKVGSFSMPKGIRAVSITPQNLRDASLRGDLWMARYFLLEGILFDMDQDYSLVRGMSKSDVYNLLFQETGVDGEPLVLPSTEDGTENVFFSLVDSTEQD